MINSTVEFQVLRNSDTRIFNRDSGVSSARFFVGRESESREGGN